MIEKILFVDDVPAVLEGYKRLLHRDFSVETAIGGAQGLSAISERGPFSVVVSDMRMPGLTGVEFLSRVKNVAPDTVRMILTGYADIETAMNAVNEGNIFRFLTKPCPRETLVKAVLAALIQYRLVIAEKELLEQTLRGSVRAMTEILSVTNPAAFGRTTRLQSYVQHLVKKLNITPCWQYEVAAMLSQLGCVTLHPDTLEAVNAGQTLSPDEQERFDKHPTVTWDLLSRIPRMESVAWMIAQQHCPISNAKVAETKNDDVIRTGTQLLRTALQYDRLLSRGLSHLEAVASLLESTTGLELSAAHALEDFEEVCVPTTVRMCKVVSLASGMVLEEDIKTKGGTLMVAKGQELTPPLVMRLITYQQHGVIPASIRVRVAATVS